LFPHFREATGKSYIFQGQGIREDFWHHIACHPGETMRIITVRRNVQGEKTLLEFRFKALDQLLDESDSALLPEREVTEVTEETIAGYVDEFPVRRPVELIIELREQDLSLERLSLLPEAIRRHFASRIEDIGHELIISKREGLYSAVLMLANAVLAVLFVTLVLSRTPDSPVILLLGGLITIMNWATIWDTYEHFVYDYRSLARKRRMYRKISGIPISVRGYGGEMIH
jgi:hypothetical protein